MKKYLFAIAMVLSLSMNADAAAQKHRHTPRTEQVDSTKNNRDAIEAFSDTTAVAGDSIDAYSNSRHVSVYADDDVDGFMEQVFGSMDGKAFTGIIIVLGTLFILFVLFPIIIIIAVIYFINRNRKDRIKLAQMAMEKGQPIPDELLKEKQASWDRSDYQTGLRQMFTGVGLAIFLGICGGIAEYLEFDPVLVRIAYAFLTLFTAFSGLIFYFVLWIVMPEKNLLEK